MQKSAGPRKNDLKKTGYHREREYDDTAKYSKNRYYVGGRELDRRSRVHRSRSRERKHGKSSSRRSRSRSRSKSYSSRRRSNSRERR